MTIREATLADVPQLVEMGRAFRLSSSYAATVAENVEQMAETATNLIASLGVVFVAEDRTGVLVGMIGLVKATHFISGVLTVSEAFWYVEDAHRGSVGVRLLHRALKWAREQGAVRLAMIQPFGQEDVGALYSALGFTCVEVAWELDLLAKDAAA